MYIARQRTCLNHIFLSNKRNEMMAIAPAAVCGWAPLEGSRSRGPGRPQVPAGLKYPWLGTEAPGEFPPVRPAGAEFSGFWLLLDLLMSQGSFLLAVPVFPALTHLSGHAFLRT